MAVCDTYSISPQIRSPALEQHDFRGNIFYNSIFIATYAQYQKVLLMVGKIYLKIFKDLRFFRHSKPEK
jgi:hypothetical protein